MQRETTAQVAAELLEPSGHSSSSSSVTGSAEQGSDPLSGEALGCLRCCRPVPALT